MTARALWTERIREFRALFWEWWDHKHGSYAHAHAAYVSVGSPHLYPPDEYPCWCWIGKDHER